MNSSSFIRRAAITVAAGVLMLAAGCRTTTPSGTSYVTKVDRELRAYVDAGLEHTHETAKQMLHDEFRFMIIEDGLDGREGFIEAQTSRGRYVRFECYLVDFNRTEVEIYVTPLGYMPLQVDILKSLGERLGTTPRATPEPVTRP